MATGVKSRAGASLAKLWENNSPGSSFSAQTVSVDLTNYDAVLIVFNAVSTDTQTKASQICLKNGVKHILTTVMAGTTTIRTRGVTVSDNGCVFTTGYEGSTSKTGSIIPYVIYGIKGL